MVQWLDFDTYAVFGLGTSGRAAANLLASRDKSVVASDTRALDELDEPSAGIADEVELVGGQNVVGDAEVVVVSPGLKPGLEVFDGIDVPVISEIELAWAAARAPILAITGTDGKSTTTVLAAHFLASAGVEHVVGGNLGTPLCALVDQVSADGYIVAEVSAFQLWSTHHFCPRAFGLTNIAFDHLDYFDGYADYVGAKRRLMHNAGPDSRGVFNADDPRIRRWRADHPGKVVSYGLSAQSVAGCADAFWLDDRAMSARVDGREHLQFIPDVDALPICGPHNMLDVMCAAGLVAVAGVGPAELGDAMATFEALPHRMEYVDTVDGVDFYDDSKATNVHAALAGLASVDGPVIAIVGGVDKGLELGELVEVLVDREAAVVVIGQIRRRLTTELVGGGYPQETLHLADTLDEAVDLAYRLAGPGDTVSLSPACSSFDMFDSYAHRGDVFQRAVGRLR